MKPLILAYVTTREGETDHQYHYDFSLSMNVLIENGDQCAVIDSHTKNYSMMTKTRVKSERDDDFYSPIELQTKTFTRRERDDESFNHFE